METRFAREACGGFSGYHRSAPAGELAVEWFRTHAPIAYSVSCGEVTVRLGHYEIYWVVPPWLSRLALGWRS